MFVGIPTTLVISGAMQVQMVGWRMCDVKSAMLHALYI